MLGGEAQSRVLPEQTLRLDNLGAPYRAESRATPLRDPSRAESGVHGFLKTILDSEATEV